jgi:hypothetical protein
VRKRLCEMSPNATFTEIYSENHRVVALLLEGSVDDTDDTALVPSCGRYPASLSLCEADSVECCQPQRLLMRPKWDRPGFIKNRPRSLAIPIEGKTDVHDLEEIPESGSDYDKATWRMYNRITYHRQKYVSKASQHAMIPRIVEQATDLTNPQWYRVSDNANLPHDVVHPPTLVQSSNCSLDGEIFEFEL